MKRACKNCEWFSQSEYDEKEDYLRRYKEAEVKVKQDKDKNWYHSEEYLALEEEPERHPCRNVRGGCCPAPDMYCQAFFPPNPTCFECRWYNRGFCAVEPHSNNTLAGGVGCSKFQPDGLERGET